MSLFGQPRIFALMYIVGRRVTNRFTNCITLSRIATFCWTFCRTYN